MCIQYIKKRIGVYLPILLLAVSQSSCVNDNRINEKYVTFEFGEEAPKLLIPVTLQDSIPAKFVFDTGGKAKQPKNCRVYAQHRQVQNLHRARTHSR